jgi:hypothetical protein
MRAFPGVRENSVRHEARARRETRPYKRILVELFALLNRNKRPNTPETKRPVPWGTGLFREDRGRIAYRVSLLWVCSGSAGSSSSTGISLPPLRMLRTIQSASSVRSLLGYLAIMASKARTAADSFFRCSE